MLIPDKKSGFVPKEPVKILILTSVRDIGSCDRNGSWVTTGGGMRRMEGIIHRTVTETAPGGKLAGLIEIAAIVTDDMPDDLAGSTYPAMPKRETDWIFPLDLKDAEGRLLSERVSNIPSRFRTLPKDDARGRAESKEAFEHAILARMRQTGADIIVSDHYMARIDHLYRWLPGKVVNIHPAVTVAGHPFCFRGKTPTADAIARAKREKEVRTGATLHFVNENIDEGPAIAYACPTPVYSTDEPEWLRYRNYQAAKLPLFVEGMKQYVECLYPHGEVS